MKPVLVSLLALISTWLLSRRSMQREIVVLRHRLGVYQRARFRPQINPADRLLWSWVSRHWSGWRDFLVFVQPRTVTAWQQARFRDHWRRLSQGGECRPVGASLIWERDRGHVRMRLLLCDNCGQRWWQHRCYPSGAAWHLGQRVREAVGVAPGEAARHGKLRHCPARAGLYLLRLIALSYHHGS